MILQQHLEIIVSYKLKAERDSHTGRCFEYTEKYLTIITLARMGSESIALEDGDRMGYWPRGHEGERNNRFSKIQLVGQKYRDKQL